MKIARLLTPFLCLLGCGILSAQRTADLVADGPHPEFADLSEALEDPNDRARNGIPAVAGIPGSPAETEPSDIPPPEDTPPPPEDLPLNPEDLPLNPEAIDGADGTAPFGPLAQQQQEMERSDEGFIIKDANLNDILQFLAKSAGRQYFHNSKITGPDYLVTGHLNDGNPLTQMEELAFMYGLSLHTKGNTIYALTQAQLAQLPSTEFHYHLRYLRPADMDQIKELIKPLLTPGTGIVNFEPKTNTIIIIDSAHRIEQARNLLHGIDRAKGQIIVETKILRVSSSAAERLGVNWAASLGRDGTPLSIVRDLNSIFGLDSPFLDSGEGGNSSNLVLSPLQLNGVLRALAEGGLANQVSNPTLITEDNEMATISIIDRVPIITSTTTPGSAGSQPIITEEVRYKIDMSDKSIDTDPDLHREIGISLVVTPTVLPDGTVRMKMRPRSAQIVDEVVSITGNKYPRVTESMVESIARVPDGHSLVIGGFYGTIDKKNDNKVPLLGDIPVINFFFKSKETVKERASLVFIVTPKSYDPTNRGANSDANRFVRSGNTLECDALWIDPDNPGPAHEPNLRRSMRGLQPVEAPYYPRSDELVPASAPAANDSSSRPRFATGRRR